jgi:hypothetical protein
MRRASRTLAVVALLVGLELLPAGARAEPIRVDVTSGTAEFDTERGRISIFGNFGFSLTAVLDASFTPSGCCVAPNTTLFFGGTWSGTDVRNSVLTLLGVRYVDVGGLTSPTSIELPFRSDPVTLPPLGDAPAIVEAPFRFTGTFSSSDGSETLRASLIGGGTGKLFLTRVAGSGSEWDSRSASFEFATNQAPIPEPSTLLLVGGAVLTMFRAKRRPSGREKRV